MTIAESSQVDRMVSARNRVFHVAYNRVDPSKLFFGDALRATPPVTMLIWLHPVFITAEKQGNPPEKTVLPSFTYCFLITYKIPQL
jgi:hypothetical protein